MGLFGDILGGIFGGGDSQSVSQTATNKTTVDLTANIANIIDVSALAEAVKAMGTSVKGGIEATAAQTQTLIASLGQAQALASLANAKEQAEQNALLKSGLGMAKAVLVLGGIWFVWKKVL
ncbi:MAG: hypothetical protein H6863_06535 [Rhodospirillales bacterium]|nr:hypothetical protein [Rhodospirillales bacterium]